MQNSGGDRIQRRYLTVDKRQTRELNVDQELTPNEIDRLNNYHLNPTYERRLVIFYDILGWRNRVSNAGQSAELIGQLRRTVLNHARMGKHVPGRSTTFSDNVVLSYPVGDEDDLCMHLFSVAALQAGVAQDGFWLRGGITIGSILHDDEVVFGPALNRAHYLESQIAKYPRIVVDRDVIKNFQNIPNFLVEENGVGYLDPFNQGFYEIMIKIVTGVSDNKDFNERLEREAVAHAKRQGLPFSLGEVSCLSAEHRLRMILAQLQKQIVEPLCDDAWEKLAWLHDRIAARVSAPPAMSYPRRRPSECKSEVVWGG